MQKNCTIIGTGTIGLPLIGILARFKEKLGIDNVIFNKNTPLSHDAAQIKQLLNLGAKLATDTDKFSKFKQLDLNPYCTKEEAIENSTVVIDCTPKGIGLKNKRDYYEKYINKVKGFIAQGSENDFGTKYAKDITKLSDDDQFVQVVSCNTHNIAALVNTFGDPFSSAIPGGVFSGDFVCLRRANDISQDSGFVPSINVGRHEDEKFGTHHAKDAFHLLQKEFPNIRLFSSAVKLNTQYMHAIRFSLSIADNGSLKNTNDVIDKFVSNPMIAVTEKMTSNKVFSFGRDYGLYGRILNQTVIPIQTIHLSNDYAGRKTIKGFAFTPQDGNSILSSLSATMHFVDSKTADEKLSLLHPYVFQEI